MRLSLYSSAAIACGGSLTIAACSLGLLWLLVGCYDISVSFEPTQPETFPQSSSQKAKASGVLNKPSNPSVTSGSSIAKNSNQGGLRMSNQTTTPVRLALLAKYTQQKNTKTATNYNLPAHWDFAPQEGSAKGLMLSLPQGNLKLEKGDILVAFAQDGSRRYWGPYVVGETPEPAWNSQRQEWQLVLN
jgi:hypothetical protein